MVTCTCWMTPEAHLDGNGRVVQHASVHLAKAPLSDLVDHMEAPRGLNDFC